MDLGREFVESHRTVTHQLVGRWKGKRDGGEEVDDGDEAWSRGSGQWVSLKQLAAAVGSPVVISARKSLTRTEDGRWSLMASHEGGEGRIENKGGKLRLRLYVLL